MPDTAVFEYLIFPNPYIQKGFSSLTGSLFAADDFAQDDTLPPKKKKKAGRADAMRGSTGKRFDGNTVEIE